MEIDGDGIGWLIFVAVWFGATKKDFIVKVGWIEIDWDGERECSENGSNACFLIGGWDGDECVGGFKKN